MVAPTMKDDSAVGNSAGDDRQQSPPCLKGGGSPTGEPGGYRQNRASLDYVGALTERPLPCHSERPEAKRRGVEESTQCR